MMQVFIANIFYLLFWGGVFYVIYVTFSCLYIYCVSFLLLWCGMWMRRFCLCGVVVFLGCVGVVCLV